MLNMISTSKLIAPTPALNALPEPKSGEAGFVTAEGDPDTSKDWQHVIASAERRPSWSDDLLDVLNDPVLDATQLATSVMASSLADQGKYAIKGFWWCLNLAEHGIKLWDAFLASGTDRAFARDPSVVPVAGMDLAAHLTGGLSMVGKSTAAIDPAGGDKLTPGYVDLASNLKLLVKATSAEVAGKGANDVFVQAALSSSSPAYGPFMQFTNMIHASDDRRSQAERLGIYPDQANLIEVIRKNASS